MELSDFPKLFQSINGRAEIPPVSTWREAHAVPTSLHLYLTLSKQLSNWKLEPPLASA